MKKGILLIAAGALSAASLAIVFFQVLPGFQEPVPSYTEVRERYRSSSARLLDREGTLLHEIRVDDRSRRLDWLTLREISPALMQACLQAEDRRFREHGGVDWRALASALHQTLVKGRTRGASTISMQLASLLHPDLRSRKGQRSLSQKWKQILVAYEMEGRWSKAEILEAYLNLVSFRGELQGISAASQGLFGKAAHGLARNESLVLACLIRAPNASKTDVMRRASQLAGLLGWETAGEGIRKAVSDAVDERHNIRPQADIAPHVARTLLRSSRSKGRNTRELLSTLDAELQRFCLQTLQRKLLEIRDRNVQDGALLVVENRSGEVLAYLGNAARVSSARYVDGVRAWRQAGSTLKPFLYALAFQNRLLTPASLIDDSPVDVSLINGIYRPSNYEGDFRGLVSARVALASSLNIPAVRVLDLVGVDRFVKQLDDLGFRRLNSGQHYGLSLALGSAEVTLWDLVNGYRTLANDGSRSGLRLSQAAAGGQPRRVLSAEAAYLVSNILADRGSRSLTFGLESPLATSYWTAVKTGTSKDMRDNWCVGYSSDYTVGVWVGNFSGQPMWDVSGMTGAAPIWVEVMNDLHSSRPSRAKEVPQGIAISKVRFAKGEESQSEWFLQGTESELVTRIPARLAPRIDYPPPGAIFALDPDIPDEQQRVFFLTAAPAANLSWVLDGERLGSAADPWSWSPRPADIHSRWQIETVSLSIRSAFRFGEDRRVHQEPNLAILGVNSTKLAAGQHRV